MQSRQGRPGSRWVARSRQVPSWGQSCLSPHSEFGTWWGAGGGRGFGAGKPACEQLGSAAPSPALGRGEQLGAGRRLEPGGWGHGEPRASPPRLCPGVSAVTELSLLSVLPLPSLLLK